MRLLNHHLFGDRPFLGDGLTWCTLAEIRVRKKKYNGYYMAFIAGNREKMKKKIQVSCHFFFLFAVLVFSYLLASTESAGIVRRCGRGVRGLCAGGGYGGWGCCARGKKT
ncbi:hypothetical protein ES288_A13G123500v1 [Gossypium darwinii]|uniref:Uncharacterized protein n=1 Tax=Gossypium darwinii TaxID=34276 RepID=A0A5D2DYZ3_GOSDA|nr:hypothetical protein ES288_A13G123500v1 [Gossypium darwinii]